MKNIISFIFFICTNYCFSQNIEDIRNIYFTQEVSINKCDSIKKTLQLIKNKNNTLHAYSGANSLLYSKVSSNIFEKFSYFEKGKTIIQQAIDKEPNNIEIKFLRYINQLNTPWFLNYKKNINEDYNFITSNLEMIKSEKLKNQIKATLKEYK